MRNTRAKAEENRQKVIEVASEMFRGRGIGDTGLSTLMSGAGLTQGGFYKQFASKEDLVVQASSLAFQRCAERWQKVIARAKGNPLESLVHFYLSEVHRDETAKGCTVAALGPESARQSEALKQVFEAGIEAHLDILDALVSPTSTTETRNASIAAFSTMIGALILARSVNDETKSKHILDAAAAHLLRDASAHKAEEGTLE